MIHYHLYISAGRQIDNSAQFFKVAVGSSAQANRDFLFLVAHAVDHGHYFALWSQREVEFCDRIARSLSLSRLPFRRVTARDLVRSFKQGSSLPLSANLLHNAHRQNAQLNLDYRISHFLSRR